MPRLGRLGVLLAAAALVPALAGAQPDRDDFHRLGRINKASIVMLAETGLGQTWNPNAAAIRPCRSSHVTNAMSPAVPAA